MLPRANELEVTVFGTGLGESAVIHLGNGKWAVVDSCIDKGSRKPAALAYLSKLQVNVARDVVLVAITHWHEDHFKGLSDIFLAAANADFAMPAPLTKTFLTSLLARVLASPNSRRTGAFELSQVFREIKRRRESGEVCAKEHGLTGKIFFVRDVDSKAFGLTALSPADDVFVNYLERIRSQGPRGDHLRYVRMPEDNDISMALWFQFEKTALLLGADLENGNSDFDGWRDVYRRFFRKLKDASLVKVPHHGSSGAHHEPIWQHFIAKRPVSIVTSYNRGTNPPPTKDDLKRLKALSSQLYFTGRPRSNRSMTRSVADKHLAAAGVTMSVPDYYCVGTVTARKAHSARKWSVLCSGSASLIS